MKGGLAFVCLVIIAALVECKPALDELRAKLEAKVADLIAKRGHDDESSSDDWPYGLMEFASLVGKCEVAKNWIQLLQLDPPTEGILQGACPHVMDVAMHFTEATGEEEKEAAKYITEYFGIIQCVNLQAAKEELELVLFIRGKNAEKHVFLKEAADLFGICKKVFDDLDSEEDKFNQDMKATDDILTNDSHDTEIQALLRQLVHTAVKKR